MAFTQNIKFSNNASTNVSSSISAIDTSITLTPGAEALFPSISTGSEYFYITISDGVSYEIAKCTNLVGNTMTVVRGQDGTTARDWLQNFTVSLRLPRVAINDVITALSSYTDSAISSGWATPGTIGSITPNTGAFSSVTTNTVQTSTSDLHLTAGSGTLTLTGATVLADGAIDINSGAIDGATIGASNPSTGTFSGLTVTGNTQLGDNSADNVTINASTITVNNTLNFDSNTFVIDPTNNYVGIGTATPSYNLDVDGQLNLSDTSAISWGGGSSTKIIGTNASNKIETYINGSVAATLNGTGLGLNIDPAYRLDVSGTTRTTSLLLTSGGGGSITFEDGSVLSTATAGTAASLSDNGDVTITYDADNSGAGAFSILSGPDTVLTIDNAGELTTALIASANVDINGSDLIIDADGDTYLHETSDDVVSMVVGGSGHTIWNATGLGIGTNPACPLHVAGASNVFLVEGYGTTNAAPGTLFRKAEGTSASPTAVSINSFLGGILCAGYTSAGAFGATNVGAIGIKAAEAFTSSAQGTYITFDTTATGATSRAERMRIDSSGNVGIGVTPSYKLHVDTGAAVDAAALFTGSNPQTKVYVENSATDGDPVFVARIPGTRAWMFGIDDSDSDAFKIAPTEDTDWSDASMVLDTSGNVGIGASPSYKLDVSGTTRTTSLLLTAGGGGQITFPDGTTMNSAGLGSASAISANGDVTITFDADNNAAGAFSLLSGPDTILSCTNAGVFTMAGSWANLGSVTTVDINGGTIDGVTIGGSSASAGTFTTLTSTGNTTVGNASGDTLTVNASTVSVPNNLNFDSNTLFIDAANNGVCVGTNTLDTNYKLLVAGNLKVTGSIGRTLATKTSDYTITAGDHYILVDATSGNVVITLPSANLLVTDSVGVEFKIKRIDTSTYTVKLKNTGADTTDGTNLDGTTNYIGLTANESITVVADGTNKWYIF